MCNESATFRDPVGLGQLASLPGWYCGLGQRKKDNCAHIKKDENAGRGSSSRLCR